MVSDLAESLQKKDIYLEDDIFGGKSMSELAHVFPGRPNSELFAAKAARARHVRMRQGELVYAEVQGTVVLGFAKLFIRLSAPLERDEFFACLEGLKDWEQLVVFRCIMNRFPLFQNENGITKTLCL